MVLSHNLVVHESLFHKFAFSVCVWTELNQSLEVCLWKDKGTYVSYNLPSNQKILLISHPNPKLRACLAEYFLKNWKSYAWEKFVSKNYKDFEKMLLFHLNVCGCLWCASYKVFKNFVLGIVRITRIFCLDPIIYFCSSTSLVTLFMSLAVVTSPTRSPQTHLWQNTPPPHESNLNWSLQSQT